MTFLKNQAVQVEVFRTNVHSSEDAQKVLRHLQLLDEQLEVNFDLEDCDRILRVSRKGQPVSVDQIRSIVEENGFKAELLA